MIVKITDEKKNSFVKWSLDGCDLKRIQKWLVYQLVVLS